MTTFTSGVTNTGGAISDTFTITTNKVADGTIIIGGTSIKNNSGITATNSTGATALLTALDLPTDATVVLDYQWTNTAGTATKSTTISTAATRQGTPNATDTIVFKKSGDFTNLSFTQIEKIKLADGVSIKISGEAYDAAGGSLDLGAFNPGVHFYGTAGGKKETVTIVGEADEIAFNVKAGSASQSTTDGAYNYYLADVQLDDASIAYLAHDGVSLKYDFTKAFKEIDNSTYGQYERFDGSNNDDYVLASDAVDNFTSREGNDTFYGRGGNDYIVGGQGADYLDGGAGDDLFVINGFAGLLGNGEGKSSTGEKQWVSGDVIVGGAGIDTLRISSGALNENFGIVTLNDSNFKSMEVVEVGSMVSRLSSQSSAMQYLQGTTYLKASTAESAGTGAKLGESYNYVTVDASDVAKNGLKFIGNGNVNTFIGTTKADTFISNGGHDVLTGSEGKDTFQFGKIHQMTANSGGTAYEDIATSITSADSDTITDFVSGTDKISLDNDFFAAFTATGKITTANLVQGAGGGTLTVLSFLSFDTDTGVLSYDADASGAGAAVVIVELTGVTSLTVNDFVIA
jgi:Ca2+-binding RTX toxin-like protein